MVLHGMIDRPVEIGRCYGMDVNVGKKTNVMRIPRHQSPLHIMIDQKQQENMEYFNYLCSMINDATCTLKLNIGCHGISCFQLKKTLLTGRLELNSRKKLLKWYTWSMALHDAGTFTLQKVD